MSSFRGFVKSENAAPFTIEQPADDVHALVDHLKLGPVVLGVSYMLLEAWVMEEPPVPEDED